MKKKLIAIVASLAMVATMVPATAFASTDSINTNGISIDLATSTEVSSSPAYDSYLAGTTAAVGKALQLNEGLAISGSATNAKVTGTIPYVEGYTYTSVTEKQQGNFYAPTVRIPIMSVNKSNVKAWAVCYDHSVKNGTGTAAAKKLTGGTSASKGLMAYDTIADSTTLSEQSITLPASEDLSTISRLEANDIGKMVRRTVYLFSAEGAKAVADIATDSRTYVSNPEAVTAAGSDYNNYGKLSELNNVLNNRAKDGSALPEGTKYVLAKVELTLDLSGLTLLTKAQTKAWKDDLAQVAYFVGIAKQITNGTIANDALNVTADDAVNTTYITTTRTARTVYDNLTADQKAIIKEAVDATAASDEKSAYENLIQAEKNVASYNKLAEVAALVKALPSADTLNLTDTAAVAQVKAAYAAVEALEKGAKAQLLDDVENTYLTDQEITNYNSLVRKVSNASVEIVTKEIKDLAALPKELTGKEQIDTLVAALEQAEEDYAALSATEKANVYNYDDMVTYRTNFDKLLKAYVSDVYETAAAIDVSQPLSDESIAVIKELKAYVDGKYVKVTDITKFDRATYNALLEALEASEKPVEPEKKSLDAATVNTIANQTYNNNKAITPAPIVTLDGATLAKDTDYTVAYANNTKIGQATVTITGAGNYTGTITTTFIIKPAKGTVSKVASSKKGQLTVTAKTQAAQGKTGYRFICKTSGVKAIGTNTTANTKTIKKLKSGKTYQVKVRAYKTINGTKYWGAYSAVKKVKVK